MVNTTRKLTKLYSLVFIFSMALLAGCGGGGGSNTTSSKSLIQVDNHSGFISGAVNGYEDQIFLAQRSYRSGEEEQFLYLYQQDPASPELLIEKDMVSLGVVDEFAHIKKMNVNAQWIATISEYSYKDEYASYISLVSREVPDNGHKLDLFLFGVIDIIDAVAYNNLLLIASERELALFDISDRSNPLLVENYAESDMFSSLVAIPGGFYAFNDSGVTYINCSDKDNIVFTEIVNEDIKQTKRAWLKENNLYIGGPSKYANMSKIAKLDITTLSSPAILYLDDRIQGNTVNFAYDSGLDKLYLAFEAADTATEPEKTLLEYTEDLDGFTQTNVLKFELNSKMGSFYVWNGFFYIDGYNMIVYKLK